jgi:xylulokinase
VNVSKALVSGPFAEAWEQSQAAPRACVEGQFLNMRSCSEWMQLKPDAIYLTGGASQNDAIAQIAADVFQAEVRRLDVPGSVALGGALRAGLCTGDLDTAAMDAFFAKASAGSPIKPKRGAAGIYQEAADGIRKLQKAATGS